MTIKVLKNKIIVYSKNKKKKLGEYNYYTPRGKKIALTKAKKRIKQVEYFKHLKKIKK